MIDDPKGSPEKNELTELPASNTVSACSQLFQFEFGNQVFLGILEIERIARCCGVGVIIEAGPRYGKIVDYYFDSRSVISNCIVPAVSEANSPRRLKTVHKQCNAPADEDYLPPRNVFVL